LTRPYYQYKITKDFLLDHTTVKKIFFARQS